MKKFMLLFFFVFCANDNSAQEHEVTLSNNDDLKSSVKVNTISLSL